MATILVIDDEPDVLSLIEDILGHEGHVCRSAPNGDAALRRLGEEAFAAALLDLRLGTEHGMDLLPRLRSRAGSMPVIMITAYGGVRDAVEAMKAGAFDFVTKPIDRNQLLSTLKNALELGGTEPRPEGMMIAEDPRSRTVLDLIARVGPTDATILITGETGTGKEIVARMIAASSRRASRPFLKVTCAALSGNLFESELFGHERGAFTGAVQTKPGRVELAQGGTLFLDEIGELPLPVQSKLLQLLQDGTYERVGGTKTMHSDARLICATNRKLEAAVAGGQFRSDLFYRINKVQLALPPLRERPLDIEPLVMHFLRRAGTTYGRPTIEIVPEAMDALKRHAWPGNVRELEHTVERMVLMAAGSVLTRHDVPFSDDRPHYALKRTLRQEKREFERDRLIEALRATNGNRTAAARALGISRRMLHRKLRQLSLTDRDL
jgi:DNA-binding NtrC family response regulator